MSDPVFVNPEELNLSDIAVAADGTAWAIDAAGRVLVHDGDHLAWSQAAGAPALTGISVGGVKEVWGVTADGEALRCAGPGSTWEPMGADFTQVGCGADAEVWGVSASGRVRRRSGSDWVDVPGVLAQISVGAADSVWGLTAAGETFRYEAGQWRQVPGRLAQLGVGADGTTLGVDPAGGLWTYAPDQDGWVESGGAARRVAVGSAEEVWLVTVAGEPFPLTGPTLEVGQPRQPIPGTIQLWDTESVFDETRSTHLWIVDRAAELVAQGGPMGQQISDLVDPTAGKGGSPFHQNLCQGLYAADFTAEYNNSVLAWSDQTLPESRTNEVLLYLPTYKSHFYDPTTGCNYLGESDLTAMSQGVRFFQESLGAYLSGDMVRAGYNLGLSLHYFTDLTQPMHSTSFTALKWPVGYHGDFESYALAVQKDAVLPSSYTYTDRGPEPSGYLLAAARTSSARFDAICPPELRKVPDQPYADLDRVPGLRQAVLEHVLPEAVQLTADYLITWMTRIELAAANPLGVYYQGGGQNGLLTVVRGGTTLWTPPATAPGTRMSQSPAAVVYKNSVHCFHQGDENSGQLWFNTSADNRNWLGDQQVPRTAMTGSPAVAVFRNLLFCFHQGGNGNGQLWYGVFDGVNWAGDRQVPRTGMSESPAVVVFRNLLFCFHQGGNGNGQLWYGVFDGVNWAGDRQVPQTAMSESPAVVVFRNLLYCFHQGGNKNGQLWYNTFDGENWNVDRQVPSTGMSKSPGLVVYNDLLYCFHQGTGENGELWVNTFDGHTWSGDHRIGDVVMSGAPSVALFTAGT